MVYCHRQEMLQLLLEAKAQADGVQRDLIQARDSRDGRFTPLRAGWPPTPQVNFGSSHRCIHTIYISSICPLPDLAMDALFTFPPLWRLPSRCSLFSLSPPWELPRLGNFKTQTYMQDILPKHCFSHCFCHVFRQNVQIYTFLTKKSGQNTDFYNVFHCSDIQKPFSSIAICAFCAFFFTFRPCLRCRKLTQATTQISCQYALTLRHQKIVETSRKHHRDLDSVRNLERPPQLKLI